MNIVLVCINNFQEYILINIEQLVRLGHDKIYIITNGRFFDKFLKYSNNLTLIDCDELEETYNFNNKTTMSKDFRGGFWMLTSTRFFYIYSFMKKYNIENVIHLENDVLVYYNCSVLDDKLNKNYVYLPFDTFQRNIASIMYIPNHQIFKEILDRYDHTKNDMENFSRIMQQTNLIQNFPIFIHDHEMMNPECDFVSQNYDTFQYIFDAAAMGQYLGGVDPRNQAGNTVGFINETCVIKYNNYTFLWKEEGTRKPFIIINGKTVPIFNLHIHSKNLVGFTIKSE